MQYHPYGNIDPSRIPWAADRLLNEYLDITKSLGVHAFLWLGTCLGFVRDGTYIIGDNDIDVGILEGIEDLTSVLIKHGFTRKREWSGNRHFLKYGILLDIYHSLSGHKFLDTFDRIPYNGREYNVPHPIDKYLKSLYGDWKIIKHRKVFNL